MSFQSLPLVTEQTESMMEGLINVFAEETDPLQQALTRYHDLLRHPPSAQASNGAEHRKQLNATLQRIRVKFHKLRRTYADVNRCGVPETVARRLPEVLLAYLVSRAFGLKFQVKAMDVRWNRGDARVSWWMQARVTDAGGQLHQYEETGPVYAVDVRDPPQMGEASRVPLYLLWMDLFLHGMRLAVPQLPWDDWMDR